VIPSYQPLTPSKGSGNAKIDPRMILDKKPSSNNPVNPSNYVRPSSGVSNNQRPSSGIGSNQPQSNQQRPVVNNPYNQPRPSSGVASNQPQNHYNQRPSSGVASNQPKPGQNNPLVNPKQTPIHIKK